MKIKLICKRCGKESEAFETTTSISSPKDWSQISLSQGYGKQSLSWAFCPDCKKAVGIEKSPYSETDADKLYDLLFNIAVEAAEEVCSQ